MTIIVAAVADNQAVWMGADGIGTQIDVKAQSSKYPCASPKVFRRGNMLFGSAGDGLFEQMLRYKFVIPRQGAKQDPDAYIIGPFAERLFKLLKDNELVKVADVNLLLGYCGRIYELQPNPMFERTARGYAATGSGEAYALGNMVEKLRKPPKDSEQGIGAIIRAACAVAIELSPLCGGEITLLRLEPPKE
jgi:hypothetical protein